MVDDVEANTLDMLNYRRIKMLKELDLLIRNNKFSLIITEQDRCSWDKNVKGLQFKVGY